MHPALVFKLLIWKLLINVSGRDDGFFIECFTALLAHEEAEDHAGCAAGLCHVQLSLQVEC